MKTKKHTSEKTVDTDPAGLSPSKRRLFNLVMLASPLVLLFVFEFTLRLFNYGGNLSLVTKRMLGGKEYYFINRAVARRYFAQPGAVIPEPADDTFEIKKSKNTKRIFCLGESTMAGFPFEFHATAPSFMRDRLKVLLPQFNVEVINVGLSAIGTFVVQDFMDELLPYEPDLFIIYVGHNEFYGIYGVGSSINVPGGPWLARLNLGLQKTRAFLLLRDGYLWLQRQLSGTDQKPSQSLMGQMVGNQTIPLHGELYKIAREVYRDNLVDLIETAQARHVPVMFSTLVSNWRGQKPFTSVFDTKTTPEQQIVWQKLVVEGDSAIAQSKREEAVLSYTRAAQIDSMNATAFFKLGNALYSLARYDEAKQALIRAKDLDALRFRATEEFENDLLTVCKQHAVPLARVDSAFISASPHGILDDNLFLEHLHPNVNGYFLMAKTFCRAIELNNLLVQTSEWNHANEPPDSVLMDLSRVTEFDRTVGRVKIDLLRRRWPFETGPVNYEFKAATSVESVVFRMIKG
ncbi:MAG: tetratricopeptide repeat protein, partial [Bacteroidota bacterium]